MGEIGALLSRCFMDLPKFAECSNRFCSSLIYGTNFVVFCRNTSIISMHDVYILPKLWQHQVPISLQYQQQMASMHLAEIRGNIICGKNKKWFIIDQASSTRWPIRLSRIQGNHGHLFINKTSWISWSTKDNNNCLTHTCLTISEPQCSGG
jgi:hypothetical protein